MLIILLKIIFGKRRKNKLAKVMPQIVENRTKIEKLPTKDTNEIQEKTENFIKT